MKARLKKKLAKKQAEPQGTARAPSPVAVKQIPQLVLECWRIEKLLPEFDGNRKALVLKSSVEKMIALLAEAGIEIEDPEGLDFRDGMTVKVALFEDSPVLPAGKRKIAETLEPGVYVAGRLVSQAKVIVSVGRGAE